MLLKYVLSVSPTLDALAIFSRRENKNPQQITHLLSIFGSGNLVGRAPRSGHHTATGGGLGYASSLRNDASESAS